MRTIYIDEQYHCHVTDDGTMTAIDTEEFDDKCDEFVEGYCIDPERKAVWPWKSYWDLLLAQMRYEQQMLDIYKVEKDELNASYQEGINSI